MKVFLLAVILIILSLVVINFNVVYSVLNGADYLGHFKNQMFFDNGKEIYVAELHPYVKGWF